MGDERAPTVNESTEQSMQALVQSFPQLMQAYQAQIAPTENAKLAASQSISPQYAALLSDLYQHYAPQLAAVGSQIDAGNRIKAAQTDADILKGPGAELAKTYGEIDRGLNPEYYKTREEASSKLAELLGSTDLNNANPEAERLVSQENARTGQLGGPSNSTNTVANALQFGDEKRKRQATLGAAISQATQFLQPASNAQFNPATTILNRPTSNTGTSQFGGITKPGSESFDSGNAFMNTISGFQNNAMQINANRRDVLDRVNETVSTL